MVNRHEAVERGEVIKPARAQQRLPVGNGAAYILRRMGITAQRDDLTAQIPVQPQDRLVWQRRVAPSGIQLDAAASRDNTQINKNRCFICK